MRSKIDRQADYEKNLALAQAIKQEFEEAKRQENARWFSYEPEYLRIKGLLANEVPKILDNLCAGVLIDNHFVKLDKEFVDSYLPNEPEWSTARWEITFLTNSYKLETVMWITYYVHRAWKMGVYIFVVDRYVDALGVEKLIETGKLLHNLTNLQTSFGVEITTRYVKGSDAIQWRWGIPINPALSWLLGLNSQSHGTAELCDGEDNLGSANGAA